MKRIALTSTGPLSGKTTLARYLHEHYGYVWANHSQTLVELFVDWWNRDKNKSQITVASLLANKEYWRPYLQTFGNEQGFNTDYDSARRYMEYTLDKVGARNTDKPVVYEPFRGELQGQVLRDLGFFLVQIKIPENVRQNRARGMGVDYSQVKASMDKAPELELGIRHPHMLLNGALTTDMMARMIVNLPETMEV